MLGYQPWQRYTPRIFFKFFLESLNMKGSSSITFSNLKNKSMENGLQTFFYFSFTLVKTWKRGKRVWGGLHAHLSSHIVSIHNVTFGHGTSLRLCIIVGLLIAYESLPFIWVIVLYWLLTLPIIHSDCFGYHYTILSNSYQFIVSYSIHFIVSLCSREVSLCQAIYTLVDLLCQPSPC